MTGGQRITMDDPSVPKYFRKMSKLVLKLWKEHNINKLRQIRNSKSNLKLFIYHHSEGTDSYFCDKEARYFTWQQVEALANESLAKDEKSMTVVLPYKSGVFFTRGSINQIKNN